MLTSARLSPLIVALLVAAPAGAQEAAQDAATAPVVRLVSPQTPPDGEAFVTIMLRNIPTQPIAALTTEIEFDARALTFVTSRLALAGVLAGATLKAELVPIDAPPGGGLEAAATRRLRVEVTGSKPIPNGPVAELRFRAAPGVDEATLRLPQQSRALAPGGAPIPGLVAHPGTVRISSAEKERVPVVFACFFYMH